MYYFGFLFISLVAVPIGYLMDLINNFWVGNSLNSNSNSNLSLTFSQNNYYASQAGDFAGISSSQLSSHPYNLFISVNSIVIIIFSQIPCLDTWGSFYSSSTSLLLIPGDSNLPFAPVTFLISLYLS